jgi:hypothetical protein
MTDRRPAVDRRRRGDVDQGMIDFGQAQAKVADLAQLVPQRLGLVHSPKELGERQRGGKTDRAKPCAQGRSAHAVDLAPACIRAKPTAFVGSRQPH